MDIHRNFQVSLSFDDDYGLDCVLFFVGRLAEFDIFTFSPKTGGTFDRFAIDFDNGVIQYSRSVKNLVEQPVHRLLTVLVHHIDKISWSRMLESVTFGICLHDVAEHLFTQHTLQSPQQESWFIICIVAVAVAVSILPGGQIHGITAQSPPESFEPSCALILWNSGKGYGNRKTASR